MDLILKRESCGGCKNQEDAYLHRMRFGLIGRNVGHSFSKAYFEDKFATATLQDAAYDLISVPTNADLSEVLKAMYVGLNVTTPYKTSIMALLQEIDEEAARIGAVNTLARTNGNTWKGFNTDHIGFEQSLLTWLCIHDLPSKALVLGSGGAAKAVLYVLRRLGVTCHVVSSGGHGDFAYTELTQDIIRGHRLIVNTTPLGMAPQIKSYPEIPYDFLTNEHWVYDLVYNPPNTVFLTRSQQAGARVKNGLDMLHLQADYAWAIWKAYGKF